VTEQQAVAEGNGSWAKPWRAYLTANVQLMERLDRELQQHSHLTLTDYEILSILSEVPENRLRMSELARKVLVSRSRLTYRIDLLAEVDFVAREECEDDRRGLWAILTPAGNAALEAARPNHEMALERWFFDLMSDTELQAIEEVSLRISDKLARNRTR
jgi:DNA-binding MarR family transcriptional regulator